MTLFLESVGYAAMAGIIFGVFIGSAIGVVAVGARVFGVKGEKE